jgi:catechol 2,3-dioxygenase-like lactoylglutathione lyase family enzyme/uncharacterized protein YndB with AHSA1/START domain
MNYPLNQMAISVSDVQRSHRWYRDIFGYQESGGTTWSPLVGADKVQGAPEATSECWWLMDQQRYFQVELFEFAKPVGKPIPADWRPCDIGYTMIGIHVDDFAETLRKLERRRVATLSDPIGEPGSRRVCVKDPDGVLLEIMEDDPLSSSNPRERPYPDVPCATRFMTVSVPDLEEARSTWVNVMGLQETQLTLHGPEHEMLWGLGGATRESFVVDAQDIFIEVVHYSDPVGKPWPEGYYITDIGILNLAIGYDTYEDIEAAAKRVEEAGFRFNVPVQTTLMPFTALTYVNDPMGFNIEMLYVKDPGKKRVVNPMDYLEMGFAPEPPPISKSRAEATTSASPERVWEVLIDSENMSDWAPFAESEVQFRPVDLGHVGTVRRLSGGLLGMAVTERIHVSEPPYRLEYTADVNVNPTQILPLPKSLPINIPVGLAISRYHAFVTLEPREDGGTRVIWEAQFRSPVPKASKVVDYQCQQLVDGLVKAVDSG